MHGCVVSERRMFLIGRAYQTLLANFTLLTVHTSYVWLGLRPSLEFALLLPAVADELVLRLAATV